VQEAAKRCAKTFRSDPGDKDYHWVVIDSSTHLVPTLDPPTPDMSLQPSELGPNPRETLHEGKIGTNGEEENGQNMEVELEDPLRSNDNANNNNNSKSAIKGSGSKIGKKGKNKGDMFLSAYERELLEWALKGFLPRGPLGGLIPTVKEQAEKAKVVEDEKTMKVLILKDNKEGSKGELEENI